MWMTSLITRSSQGFAALAFLAAFACGPELGGGGSSGGSTAADPSTSSTRGDETTGQHGSSSGLVDDDATTSGGATETAGTTDSSSSGSTTGSDLLCPGVNECIVAPNCDLLNCGHVNSWVDADGCPRPPCEGDTPCPEGMRCHNPWLTCTVCVSDLRECSAGIGGMGPYCSCNTGRDCDGQYCVPDSIPVDDCQGD